jgi:hypothetical protein
MRQGSYPLYTEKVAHFENHQLHLKFLGPWPVSKMNNPH